MRRSRSPSSDFEVDPDYADEMRTVSSPSKRLLVAIVRRAVWDFVLYAESEHDNPDAYALHVEAAEWLFWNGEEETNGDGRFSFLHICRLLDLEPKEVRAKVVKMTRDDIQRLNNKIKED